MKAEGKITGTGFYALVFGLFLGLAILKFGNPVILDQKIPPPVSASDFWADAWWCPVLSCLNYKGWRIPKMIPNASVDAGEWRS